MLAEVALQQADAGLIVVGEQSEARSAIVAYAGTVAIAAQGGEWVLLPGPADHENPFVGRPFVERVDSDGGTAVPPCWTAASTRCCRRDRSIHSSAW